MTDNEIIKALEMCQYGMPCERCPYDGLEFCRGDLAEDARNLINRQKAEIERLDGYVETMKKSMWPTVAEVVDGQISDAMEFARSEAIKEFAERLKRVVAIHNGDMWSKYDYIDNLVKEMVGEDNE